MNDHKGKAENLQHYADRIKNGRVWVRRTGERYYERDNGRTYFYHIDPGYCEDYLCSAPTLGDGTGLDRDSATAVDGYDTDLLPRIAQAEILLVLETASVDFCRL